MLAGTEHATVLAQLLASHPDLRPEAEQLAVALLGTDTIDGVADDVAWALGAIPLEDLAARSGRVRGRGYVHENEAAYDLLSEAVEPFLADVRRRAVLGLVDAAVAITTGIVAGLYQSRAPEDGTVLGFAGADTISELADDAFRNACEHGVPIPPDTAERHWPEWSSLG
ncbi:MAG: hypothetical protein ACR2KK_07730 [Acidimicrobiales bacterium]